jgi:hypothetical protein
MKIHVYQKNNRLIQVGFKKEKSSIFGKIVITDAQMNNIIL